MTIRLNFINLFMCLLAICSSCTEKSKSVTALNDTTSSELEKSHSSKIQVLNVGTFHFGYTPDANKVEFNEKGENEQLEVKVLDSLLAKFKPTVILVEATPERNKELNEGYQDYLKNHEKLNTNWGEISMVAYEVGRLNGVEKIYGIDHHTEYNYNIGNEMINAIDSVTYRNFFVNPFKTNPELNVDEKNLSLIDKFKLMNNPKYQEFLLNVNADILTYVGSENGFEGADEAAKLYQRNLRMFSNIHRIPLKNTDRVFIISGGLHAAFITDLMKRSPKYELVNPLDYLK